MNCKYTESEKQSLIERYLSGESALSILEGNSIPRSTLYSWIKFYRDKQLIVKQKAVNLTNFRLLENKVKRLEGIIEILQTASCSPTAPLGEKLIAIENLYGQYNVHMLCEAFDVSRGTFYNHILRNKRGNSYNAKRREELRMKIQEVYDDSNQIFGAGKITAVLKNNGFRASQETVLELMRDMGLVSIRQSAKSIYLKDSRKFKNHLNQEFHTDKPNQVWVSDVTYFRYNEKSYCICVIIDLFCGKVVGCRVGPTNSTQLVKSTFKKAYESRHPDKGLIFHTDRGSNYRSKTFSDYLKLLQVTQSFSRAYVPYDNSVAESFFSSMKREELYRTKYHSESEFHKAVYNYIVFYNTKRPHLNLKYKTPEQAESDFGLKQRIAE